MNLQKNPLYNADDKENQPPAHKSATDGYLRGTQLKSRPRTLEQVSFHQGRFPLDSAGYDQPSSPNDNIFQFPPPMVLQLPPSVSSLCQIDPSSRSNSVSCVVDQEGFLCLQLRSGVFVDISPKLALRLRNTRMGSTIALSSCSTQMALVHPSGRLLQYGPRVEIQTEDKISIKNAKVHPKGVSFTANNCALVYLLDEAGARSTSDMFHDLHATHIADTLFMESSNRGGDKEWAVKAGMEMLEQVQYWKEGDDNWRIGDVWVKQTRDGLVTVERQALANRLLMKTSPNNGKVRFDSRLVQMTASLGEESHLFLRAGDRRLHYCGQSTVFTVRNAGHSAGFDEAGSLRIF